MSLTSPIAIDIAKKLSIPNTVVVVFAIILILIFKSAVAYLCIPAHPTKMTTGHIQKERIRDERRETGGGV